MNINNHKPVTVSIPGVMTGVVGLRDGRLSMNVPGLASDEHQTAIAGSYWDKTETDEPVDGTFAITVPPGYNPKSKCLVYATFTPKE